MFSSYEPLPATRVSQTKFDLPAPERAPCQGYPRSAVAKIQLFEKKAMYMSASTRTNSAGGSSWSGSSDDEDGHQMLDQMPDVTYNQMWLTSRIGALDDPHVLHSDDHQEWLASRRAALQNQHAQGANKHTTKGLDAVGREASSPPEGALPFPCMKMLQHHRQPSKNKPGVAPRQPPGDNGLLGRASRQPQGNVPRQPPGLNGPPGLAPPLRPPGDNEPLKLVPHKPPGKHALLGPAPQKPPGNNQPLGFVPLQPLGDNSIAPRQQIKNQPPGLAPPLQPPGSNGPPLAPRPPQEPPGKNGLALSQPPGQWQKELAPPQPQPNLTGSEELEDITSLMICDIPCRITRNVLVEKIDSLGFVGTYDFLHLPIPSSASATKSNLGYGFINFVNPESAEQFSRSFHNYRFEGTASKKACKVRPARVQGLANNLLQFDVASKKRYECLSPVTT